MESPGSRTNSTWGAAAMRSAALLRDGQARLDRVAVGVEAVHGHGEPQRQPAGPARQVEGVVARIPLLGVLAVQHLEVLRVLGVHRLGQVGLSVDQRGAVEGREQPLVGVDDERVGPLESGELLAHRRGEERRRAAVGAVDVEPQRMLCRDVGHAVEVVHDAGVGRPRRGHDADDVAPAAGRRAGPPQRVAGQPMVQRRHGQRAHAEHVQGLADRRVGVLADGDERPLAAPRPGAGRPPCRGPP